jgi:hypothetical protein
MHNGQTLSVRDKNIITENLNCNYNHVVQELQDYMLDARLLSRNFTPKNVTTYESENDKKTLKEEKQMKKEPERFFFPKEKDQLFWCYYILQHGFAKYEYPGTTTFVNEKTEKFKCIDEMRLNKQQLKVKKIKNIVCTKNGEHILKEKHLYIKLDKTYIFLYYC